MGLARRGDIGMGDGDRSVEDLLGTVLQPVRPASDVGATGTANVPSRHHEAEAGAVAQPGMNDAPDAVAYVYVPIQPRKAESDPETVTFEIRSLDGEPGLAVYTDRDRLIASLGEYQPHVRIPVLRLLVRLARETLPIAVDPVLAPGAEKWTQESIRAWQAGEE